MRAVGALTTPRLEQALIARSIEDAGESRSLAACCSNRPRNSHRRLWSKPGSVMASPSRYFLYLTMSRCSSAAWAFGDLRYFRSGIGVAELCPCRDRRLARSRMPCRVPPNSRFGLRSHGRPRIGQDLPCTPRTRGRYRCRQALSRPRLRSCRQADALRQRPRPASSADRGLRRRGASRVALEAIGPYARPLVRPSSPPASRSAWPTRVGSEPSVRLRG